ncbi:MAG: hypothetical protein KJO43_04020 [Phycisphaerae bacterium]|nr:hypothetical protein [Phycisphaerae bacterium]
MIAGAILPAFVACLDPVAMVDGAIPGSVVPRLRVVTVVLGPVVGAIVTSLAAVAVVLGARLGAFVAGLAAVAVVLGPIVDTFVTGLAAVAVVLGPIVDTFVTGLCVVAAVLGPIVDAFVTGLRVVAMVLGSIASLIVPRLDAVATIADAIAGAFMTRPGPVTMIFGSIPRVVPPLPCAVREPLPSGTETLFVSFHTRGVRGLQRSSQRLDFSDPLGVSPLLRQLVQPSQHGLAMPEVPLVLHCGRQIRVSRLSGADAHRGRLSPSAARGGSHGNDRGHPQSSGQSLHRRPPPPRSRVRKPEPPTARAIGHQATVENNRGRVKERPPSSRQSCMTARIGTEQARTWSSVRPYHVRGAAARLLASRGRTRPDQPVRISPMQALQRRLRPSDPRYWGAQGEAVSRDQQCNRRRRP